MISRRAHSQSRHPNEVRVRPPPLRPPPQDEITRLLLAWSDGDKAALEELTLLVYAEMRRLAERHMHRERAGRPLQTIALANEAYVRSRRVVVVHKNRGGGVMTEWRRNFGAIETQGQTSGPCGNLRHRPAFISLPSGSFTNKLPPSILYSTSLPATRSLERSCCK